MLSQLNTICHGYVAAPIIAACMRNGLFDALSKLRTVQELVEELGANEGYLAQSLRALEVLSLIRREDGEGLTTYSAGAPVPEVPLDLVLLYRSPFERMFSTETGVGRFTKGVGELLSHAGRGQQGGTAAMMHGSWLVPLLAHLRLSGDPESAFEQLPISVSDVICKHFVEQSWGVVDEKGFRLHDTGRDLIRGGDTVAIAASYRPLLARMESLLFGEARSIFQMDGSGCEQHVDRRLNVIASGAQHTRYFADAHRRIADIFDTDDFSGQPDYIADMGCGDGTFLAQLYRMIESSTKRGEVLDRYPLTLVGMDFSADALLEARGTLAEFPSVCFEADINAPIDVQAELARHGIGDRDRVLHVRSFLDHNFSVDGAPEPVVSESSDGDSIYIAQSGERVPAQVVHTRWQKHLSDWSEILGKHGLLVLEAHTLPVAETREYLEVSENFYFDTLHGLSHQYLISAADFTRHAGAAGLFNVEAPKTYPKTLPYSRITLTHLHTQPFRIRRPTVEDTARIQDLDRACWAPELRAGDAVIEHRVREHPECFFLLEARGLVVGAVYYQFVADDTVGGTTIESIDRRFDPRGRLAQLVGINIDPAYQEHGYGDRLLEFTLQYLELLPNIDGVIGISRCKNFGGQNASELEAYVREVDCLGLPLDPILKLHALHGAEIVGLVPGFRAADEANLGNGVLVRYRIGRRKPNSIRAGSGSSSQRFLAMESAGCDPLNFVRDVVKACLGEGGEEVYSDDSPLMEMGLDSADLMELSQQIQSAFAIDLDAAFFFEYPTCAEVGAYLSSRVSATEVPTMPIQQPAVDDIAIVGASCELPGGVSCPEDFWRLLTERRSGIREVPQGRFRAENLPEPIRLGGFLDNEVLQTFDADLFRVSPREARTLDPNQRLMLGLALRCLEDASISPEALESTATGVFIGASASDFESSLGHTEIEGHSGTSCAMSLVANRISYFFDWRGPSVLVDTACSSSLVAVHQAARSIRFGECEAALVGGINLIFDPRTSMKYWHAGMLSPTGQCRTFDRTADGYVRGEGAVCLLLKSRAAAERDGDRIYGLLKGSCVNHGGRASGLTVPNPSQQRELLASAWRDAGGEPVSYLEAHGTGTALGDPIELKGIVTAREKLGHSQLLAVGSVKSNIGHLEAAAGIAGLLKSLLCLQHRQFVPSLHFEEMRGDSPTADGVYVVTESKRWQKSGRLRAGVSSFGFGGANAHVVVEEYQAPARRAPRADSDAFLLSAPTKDRLVDYARSWSAFLSENSGPAAKAQLWFSQLCATLARREQYGERLAVIHATADSTIGALQAFADGERALDTRGLFYSGQDHAVDEPCPEADVEQWVRGGTSIFGERYRHVPSVGNIPGLPFRKRAYWPDVANRQVAVELDESVSELPQSTATSRSATALIEILAEVTELRVDEIDQTTHFEAYGIDSILITALVGQINARFDLNLRAVDLHTSSTVAGLARVIDGLLADGTGAPGCVSDGDGGSERVNGHGVLKRASPVSTSLPERADRCTTDGSAASVAASDDIAIVGVHLKTAGTDSLETFKAKLRDTEIRAVGPYPTERWKRLPEALQAVDGDVFPTGSFLEDILRFDHRLFNISPREAMLMDPQQRMALQSVWRAIEDAGYNKSRFAQSPTACLLAISSVDYFDIQKYDARVDQFSASGVSRYIAANRLSHYFGLSGLSEPVDTACSSVFVALDKARSALAEGIVDQAVVCGVQANLSPQRFSQLSQQGLLSEDAQAHPFDQRANGFVRAEGVGTLILKRLDEAQRDGDHVYGVIKGVGVWHAGRSIGLTSPNVNGHVRAGSIALRRAGVAFRDLSHVELHGTATVLGDSTEISAMHVLRDETRSSGRAVSVGCLKPSIGHLEAASGIAAILKGVVALDEGAIQGVPGFRSLHPEIALDPQAFRIASEDSPLTAAEDGGYYIGLNSYGLGGVAAFVVLAKPDPSSVSREVDQACSSDPFVLSAASIEQLREYAGVVADHLSRRDGGLSLERIKQTALEREVLPVRLAAACVDADDLHRKLERFAAGETLPGIVCSGCDASQIDAAGMEVRRWIERGETPRRVTGRRAVEPMPGYRFDLSREFWIQEQADLQVDPPPKADQHEEPVTVAPAPQAREQRALPTRQENGARHQAAAAYHTYGNALEAIKPLHRRGRPSNLLLVSDSIDVYLATQRYVADGELGSMHQISWRELGSFDCNTVPFRELDQVVVVVGPEHSASMGLNTQLIRLFDMVQRCLERGCGERDLELLLLTESTGTAHPLGMAVAGMLETAVHETPRWRFRHVEAEFHSDAWIEWLDFETTHERSVVQIGDDWFARKLKEVDLRTADISPFRQNGVYVVIGGAGGIGRAVSKHLIEEAAANLVWLGRRPHDLEMDRVLGECEIRGILPTYIQANASSVQDLNHALNQVEREFGTIDGVIVAAMELNDRAIAHMSQREFLQTFESKAGVSRALRLSLAGRKPDFVYVLSSINALSRPPGQANYNAGCCFQDADAEAWDAESDYAVRTIDLGYWGSIGRVTDPVYQRKFERQGLASIEIEEVWPLIKAALLSDERRLLVVKTTQRPNIPTLALPEPEVNGPADCLRATLCRGRAEFETLLYGHLTRILRQADANSARPDYLERWRRASESLLEGRSVCLEGLDWRWDRFCAEYRHHPFFARVLPSIQEVVACGADVLNGTYPATQALFPGGTLEIVEGLYNNARADFFNEQMAITVQKSIGRRCNTPRSVLEIGAGTGSTTRWVLDALAPHARTLKRYVYTDVSHAFLKKGKSNLSGFPFVEFRIFDMENQEHVRELGCALQTSDQALTGGFDVILAANVLHIAKDIRSVLANIRQLLKPGGVIVISELHGNLLEYHMTFGLLEGWWRGEDRDIREDGSPAVSRGNWKTLFEESAYTEVEFPTMAMHDLGHQVIRAKKR